jgi:tetratricopeptide (TPR) repeat protein
VSDPIVNINVRGVPRKLLTLLPLLLALIGVWFSVRWFVGNTIAETISRNDNAVETARTAVGLAPTDPLAHWTLAEVEQNRLSLDQANLAIDEYDQAVRLAPHDYRFWLAWGRALEQFGDSKKAEQAMRQAVALAPSYSFPRWYLGNLLLRDGRNDEAFAELRTASEADPQLRPQVFSLMWQVYGQSSNQLSKAVGSSGQARAEFARYLVERNNLEPGLALWRELSAVDKTANRQTAEGLVKLLVDGKHFPQALEVANDLAPSESARGKLGEIDDGGFEGKTSETAGVFKWQIKFSQQAQATFDRDVKHSGNQSLRLIFKARAGLDLSVSQLVVLQPNSQYDFEGFLKTNKLESAATPTIEIVDGMDGTVLATSEAAPAGFNDWQRFTLAFKTGSKTEGIFIRLGRASCGENSTCPLFGTLWYDDFSIKRRG